MKHLFTLVFLLSSLAGARAQQVYGGLSLQLLAPLGNEIEPGESWAIEAWGELALRDDRALKVTFGYRQIHGYDSRLRIMEEQVLPSGRYRSLQDLHLKRLQHLHASMAYVLRPVREDSRWAFEVGLRTGFGSRAKGPYRNSSLGVEGTGFNERLRGFDIGPEAKVCFFLFNGCWLEAGLYQGLLNQWAKQDFEVPRLFVTTASLGLAFQLF